MNPDLVALPVVMPLTIGALLLLFNPLLPGRVPDIIAIATAVFAGALSVMLLIAAARGPLTCWFGGWTPRQGQTIGIAFVVDQGSALVGVFAALLVTADFVFAWGFFKEVGARFHSMMLVFLGAMIGFAFTHDLFNLFVWFEVMSVAAFALTAYHLNESALEGALTFTVTNGIGSYMMLGGIGLLYLAAGALDFGALETFVRAHPNSPLVAAAFCLIAGASVDQGRNGAAAFLAVGRACGRAKSAVGDLFRHHGAAGAVRRVAAGVDGVCARSGCAARGARGAAGAGRGDDPDRRHGGAGAAAYQAHARLLDDFAHGRADRGDRAGDAWRAWPRS